MRLGDTKEKEEERQGGRAMCLGTKNLPQLLTLPKDLGYSDIVVLGIKDH